MRVLPEWGDFGVDRVSGRFLLEAPLPDLSGLDVTGLEDENEEAVGELGERAAAFFASGSRPARGLVAVPRETPGEQLPLPAPVPRRPVEPKGRTFGWNVPAEDDDDEVDDDEY